MIQLRFTDGSVGTVAAIKRYTLHHDGNGSLRSICGEHCTCGGRPTYRSLSEASAELDRRLGKDYSIEAVRRELQADAELARVYAPSVPEPHIVGSALDQAVKRNMSSVGGRDYASAMAAVLAVHPELRDDLDGEYEEKPTPTRFQIKTYPLGGGAQ